MILEDENTIIELQKEYNKNLIAFIDKVKENKVMADDYNEPCAFFMELLGRCLIGTSSYEQYTSLSNTIVQDVNLLLFFKDIKTKSEIVNFVKNIN